VLRACNSASKYAHFCVLEQEQSCGKSWGENLYFRLLPCSSQLQGKCTFNGAVHYKYFPLDTHTKTRRPSRSAEQINPSSFIALPSLVSLFPSLHSCTMHHHFCDHYSICFNFFTEYQPLECQGLLLLQFHNRTQTHHTRYAFCVLVFSNLQRPLLESVLNRESFTPSAGFEHAQCLHVNGRRPTP